MAPTGLCENCHQRPKFSTHRFCGKTCAAQVAITPAQPKQSRVQTKAAPRNAGYQKAAPQAVPQKVGQLCLHCGQNPKYNSFDYCGKSCAALASAARTRPPLAQGIPAPGKQKTMRVPNATPNNNNRTPAPAKHRKTPQTNVPVPQDDSTEEEEEEEDGGVSTDLDAYPSDSGSESEDSPSVPAVAVPQSSAKTASRGGKPGGGVPRIPPGTCAIPGCSQPSHIDKKGVTTMYCSTKHREEAVRLGLEEPCIMCQRYPQGISDYFCSSACRNQSMTKT